MYNNIIVQLLIINTHKYNEIDNYCLIINKTFLFNIYPFYEKIGNEESKVKLFQLSLLQLQSSFDVGYLMYRDNGVRVAILNVL